MNPYSWVLLISALIWAVVLFLFRHTYDDWSWDYLSDKCKKKVWSEEDRLTAPLWMYILVAISLFIPVLNVIIATLALIIIIVGYCNDYIYLHIELPEQLKFLTEEY